MMRKRRTPAPLSQGAGHEGDEENADAGQGLLSELAAVAAYSSKYRVWPQPAEREATIGEGAPAGLELETKPEPERGRSISLYWEEKLCMLLGFCQHFALLRLMSPAWSWPPFWRRWTHSTLLFVLDVPAFLHTDLDNFVARTHLTSWPWFVSAWAGSLALLLLCGLWCTRRDASPLARRLLLFVLELLYIPALVALPRLFVCAREVGSARSGVVAMVFGTPSDVKSYSRWGAVERFKPNPFVDELGKAMFTDQLECASAAYVAAACATAALFALYLIGLPVIVWRAIRSQIIYATDKGHEMWLRSGEVETLLGINDVWHTGHFYCFSSYRRIYAYNKVYTCVRSVLLAAALLLRPEAQTTLFLATVAANQISVLVWPCYRAVSSRAMYSILGWMIICNASSGFLKTSDVHSWFLVDSNLQHGLLGINLIGLLLVVKVMTFSLCVLFGRRKATVVAETEARVGWPVSLAGLPARLSAGQQPTLPGLAPRRVIPPVLSSAFHAYPDDGGRRCAVGIRVLYTYHMLLLPCAGDTARCGTRSGRRRGMGFHDHLCHQARGQRHVHPSALCWYALSQQGKSRMRRLGSY